MSYTVPSPIKTSLFYGLFLEAVPLLIAAKAQIEYIKRYHSVLLQLSTRRSRVSTKRRGRSSSSSRIIDELPLEIWDKIKQELLNSLLKECELDLLFKTYCRCCSTKKCSEPGVHSFPDDTFLWSWGNHMNDFEENYASRQYRCCEDCRGELDEFFENSEGLGTLGTALWKWKYGICKDQLRGFLSLFDLELIDHTFIRGDCSFIKYFAVGAIETIAVAVDESPRNPYSTTKTLSTQSFLNLDYAVVNCSFRILYFKYGLKGDEPDMNNSSSVSTTRSGKSLELEGSKPSRKTLPAWRLWTRSLDW